VLSGIDIGPKKVILDLSQINFIDSSGLGALVRIAKHLKENNGKLQIVTNARVTQTVKMVRLEKYLELQPDLETALSNLQKSD
jgi:anti-anti-sigma factor